MSPPKTTRVTIKNLQESLQKVLGKNDDLKQTVEHQRKALDEQRVCLQQSWAEARELRNRLSSLECILQGAVQVARTPQMTLGRCDVAMAPEMIPESPR